MARLTTLYCTDEDIAIRVSGDYAVLTPAESTLAFGNDGVIAAGTPWVLTSATNDFAAQGVKIGHTVKMVKPEDTFRASGTMFAVESATGNSVTLRRLGKDAGFGYPPVPAGRTGITFTVESLDPLIEKACDDINRRYGIDPASSLSGPANLYDLRELEQATVLTVLYWKYQADNRSKDSAFSKKTDQIYAERQEVFSRLSIRYGAAVDVPSPAPPVFGARADR